MKANINKDEFIKVCESSITASEAARKLNLHFNTFKRYALKFGCYFTNQSGKGMSKKERANKIPTTDILSGLYPDYPTYKLKLRLFKEKIKNDGCEICG